MRKFILAFGLALSATALGAQTPQDKVAAFRQLLAENQQKRRMFTWLETTQIAYQGVVKVTKLSDCQFNATNPKPICTELSLQPAPLPSGFLRKKIAEKKEGEMKSYMDSVRTLLAEYVPLQPGLIQNAYEAGNVAVSPDPMAGSTRLVISNYRHAGDKVTITYNSTSKKLQQVQLSTWLNTPDAVVTVHVQFATLPNGVFYAYQKVLVATAAQLTVTVTSSDFAEIIQQ